MQITTKENQSKAPSKLLGLTINFTALGTIMGFTPPTAFGKANAAEAKVLQEDDEKDEVTDVPYKAPISGWRIGVGIGHSPVCLGSKREFGHYRCGRYSEAFVSPPADQHFFVKVMAHNLKSTRIISEDPISARRTYEIEEANLSGLQLGRTWDLRALHYGFGAGTFGGSITRKTEAEDEYGNLKPDEHGRNVSISGYAFSVLAGTTFAKTEAGDFSMDVNQTWYVTTEADNPRDERRVWASLPTLTFAWSHQFD